MEQQWVKRKRINECREMDENKKESVELEAEKR